MLRDTPTVQGNRHTAVSQPLVTRESSQTPFYAMLPAVNRLGARNTEWPGLLSSQGVSITHSIM